MTLAGTLGYRGVATAYRHRPPYPDEVFTRLSDLLAGPSDRGLDLTEPEANGNSVAELEAHGNSGAGLEASLHWMDTRVVLSRLAGVLADGAVLVIVEHGPVGLPWRDDLTAIIRRHSRQPGYRPDYSIADALTA